MMVGLAFWTFVFGGSLYRLAKKGSGWSALLATFALVNIVFCAIEWKAAMR
jgi:hypothetical protein